MALVTDSIQIDNLLFGNGINLRSPIRAATTGPGALATDFENSDVIDGVTLSTGDRILIKNQVSGVENGIYIVQSSGAPLRDEDLLSGFLANNINVWIEEGSSNKTTSWVCTNTVGADIVGTNALTWAKAGGNGTVTIPPGTGVDNQVVRFDGTSGSVQGSAVTMDDSGNMTGVGDITFDETTNDLTLAAADQGTGAATATLPDLGGTNQDVVMTQVAQTLTNKTLDAPVIQNNVVFDEATNDLTLAVTDQATGAATATIPDLGGISQDFVFTVEPQTLTNKRLDNPEVVNNIDFVEASGTLVMSVTDQVNVTANIPDLGGVSQDFVFTQEAQTLSNKTLVMPVVQNNIVFDEATNDFTMAVNDQGTGAATGTVPDLGGISQDFVFTQLPQTLTNKTFGDDLDMDGNTIINVATPINGTDAVNKDYVDSVASGLDPKESVRAATTSAGGDLGGTYTDASPDTITGAPLVIDGVTLAVNDRVLVKNQTDPLENGIYEVTAIGATSSLQRADDHDGTPANEVSAGNFTFVEQGTTQSDTGWVLQGDGILTLNTDPLNWTQFSGSGTFLAGDGLLKTGNVFSVNVSDVTTGIVSDDVVVRSTGTAGQVIRSTGTAGAEASWGSVDLANNNAVTGTLPVPRGGTGGTTFTSGNILQGNGTGPITSTGIATSTIITTTGTQTLSNKSLIDASTYIIDDIDNSKRFRFQVASVTTATTREFTVPNVDTTLVGTDATQTLSNKTLTTPRFVDLGYIADASGNEMLIFDSNASAVNNFQISNASSTNAPTITAVGGDTNISLALQPKGTGVLNLLGTSAQQFQMRLFEDTDNGSNYVAIQPPAALASNWTLTLPPNDGTSGQLLRTDGNGVTTWVDPPSARISYKWLNLQVKVTVPTPRAVAYHAWDNSEYTDLGNTMRVVFWAEDLTNRSLTVAVHDGTSTIGTITVPSGTADGIQTFTVTKPTNDVRLELRVNKNAGGGTSPRIYGAQLEFTA